MNPEKAIFFSGGGFSRYFSQPSYQTAAVNAFLKNLGDTYKGLYKCDLSFLAFRELPLNSD